MLDYIIILGLEVFISQVGHLKLKLLISFPILFQWYIDFLISFKVGFTFRWETCLIWFWYIISSSSNSRRIINHSSFKLIFLSLWWFTFENSFILFCIILLIFRLLLFYWFLFFAIWYFITESQLIFILINQLLESLLLFKSKHSNNYLINPMKFYFLWNEKRYIPSKNSLIFLSQIPGYIFEGTYIYFNYYAFIKLNNRIKD